MHYILRKYKYIKHASPMLLFYFSIYDKVDTVPNLNEVSKMCHYLLRGR